MLEGMKDAEARLRATIEDELAGLRRLADAPAVEIEEIAARIARAVAPMMGPVEEAGPASRAA